MKKLLILILAVCLASHSSGQNGKLEGKVLDSISNIPLGAATISILEHDTSIVNFQLSDADGNFSFKSLPARNELKVNVSFVGYKDFNRYIKLDGSSSDTLEVLLSVNLNHDDTIVVTSAVPIRMNGDTLEINPAAFNMEQNAVVEELLVRVPGVTIWSDGSITVNGKKVQNVYVDGKIFLNSSDPRMATQNLPKEAIEKIQLYEEYDRTQIGREQQQQDSILSMNIKLKESYKKGYFGKMSAGYGTDKRYEGDLSFQTYSKLSSIGIGGGTNNINKSIGNLQEIFQNNTYRQWNPNLYNVGKFNTNGINRNHSIGGVLVHDFIETTNSRQNNRLSLNYNHSGNDALIVTSTLQHLTVVDDAQQTQSEFIQNSSN